MTRWPNWRAKIIQQETEINALRFLFLRKVALDKGTFFETFRH